MNNFIIDCINGITKLSKVDDYIDLWHTGTSSKPLHEFLGMTLEDYHLFVKDENHLKTIIQNYKSKTL